MELGLTLVGDKQITQSGFLYEQKLGETLHRITRYRVNFMDKSSKELTYKQYENILAVLAKGEQKFIKFADGEMYAVNQIVSVVPYKTIVDTRKDNL